MLNMNLNRLNIDLTTLLICLAFSQSDMALGEDFPGEAFSEEDGIKSSEKANLDINKTELGGKLEIGSSLSTEKLGKIADGKLLNAALLGLVINSELQQDSRVLIRSQIIQDFAAPNPEFMLEEAKVQYNLDKVFFVSAGRQKIKYGSGFIWNPTDFLNSSMKSPYETDDMRIGIDALKLHVPVNNMNFYGLLNLKKAQAVKDVGLYFRAEIALMAGEAALSVNKAKNGVAEYGLDLSSKLGPFDAHIESALANGSNKTILVADKTMETGYLKTTPRGKFYARTAAGISYDLDYNSKNELTIAAEYYDNQEGYASKDLALTALANGYANYLHSGQKYIAVNLVAPKPFSLNKTSFILIAINNLSDKSYSSRFASTYEITKDISLMTGISKSFGTKGAELNSTDKSLSLESRIQAKF